MIYIYICKQIQQNESSFGRESGYTFKIFSNEEERMHVHVVYERNEAKFWLEPRVELAKNSGFSEHELNVIRKIVERNAEQFKKQYKEHVGKRFDD